MKRLFLQDIKQDYFICNAQNLPAIIVFSGSDGRIEKAQNMKTI